MSIELLMERVAIEGRVDRANSVIHGVRVLGARSRNNRTYTESAMRAAIPLYEGAKVNVDHPPKNNPNQPRGYGEQFGRLQNVRFQNSGVTADLRFNPKHALAEQVLWDAEHDPTAFGLSHNASCRTSTKSGVVVVESIISIVSVDLVCEPATTAGLYESAGVLEHVEVDPRSYAERLRNPDYVSPERIARVVARYTGRWTRPAIAASVPAQAAYRSRTPAETAAKYRSL